MRTTFWTGLLASIVAVLLVAGPTAAQSAPTPVAPATPDATSVAPSSVAPSSPLNLQLPDLTNRQTFSSALQLLVLLTILSLAPAIIIMMTSFTRIVIVLSLLRQALGTQQLPPNQILIGLAIFMTFLVMGPTIDAVNAQALQPFLNGSISQPVAIDRAAGPVREFMITQIDRYRNWEDVEMFNAFTGRPPPKTWGDVGTMTLIPAFMLGELKTAFMIGFTIYLPFLVIDMVISTVLISMGMMMLPPALISLPFKLLLFVLVDGWRLIVMNLISGFQAT